MSGVTPAELVSRIGQTLGTSEWLLVDQDMVNKFADATGDHQFIHVNEEMAKMTPFGGTIAHGFLSLSLLPVLMAKSDCPRIDGVKMGVNYGGNKTRFLAPVRVGKNGARPFQTAGARRKAPRPMATGHRIYAGDRRRRQARLHRRMDNAVFCVIAQTARKAGTNFIFKGIHHHA